MRHCRSVVWRGSARERTRKTSWPALRQPTRCLPARRWLAAHIGWALALPHQGSIILLPIKPRAMSSSLYTHSCSLPHLSMSPYLGCVFMRAWSSAVFSGGTCMFMRSTIVMGTRLGASVVCECVYRDMYAYEVKVDHRSDECDDDWLI